MISPGRGGGGYLFSVSGAMIIVRCHVKDYSWGIFHHCFDHCDHDKQHSFSLLTIKTLIFNFVFQMDGWVNRSIHLTIAGLRVTSRRSRQMSRTKPFLSSGNLTLFSCKFFQKKLCCIVIQHGRLVTWLQTKNLLHMVSKRSDIQGILKHNGAFLI